MKQLSIILVIFLALCSFTRAQTEFGLKAGLNLADMEGSLPDINTRYAWQTGVLMSVPLGDAFDMKPNILISSKGYHSEFNDEDQQENTFRVSYLEIPLNLSYNIKLARNGELQLITGAFVAFGLNGKYIVETTTDGNQHTEENEVNFTDESIEIGTSRYAAKKTDYGINSGLGYRTGNVQIQAIYGLGLPNIVPPTKQYGTQFKLHHSVFQFTVAYYIQLNSKSVGPWY